MTKRERYKRLPKFQASLLPVLQKERSRDRRQWDSFELCVTLFPSSCKLHLEARAIAPAARHPHRKSSHCQSRVKFGCFSWFSAQKFLPLLYLPPVPALILSHSLWDFPKSPQSAGSAQLNALPFSELSQALGTGRSRGEGNQPWSASAPRLTWLS